MEELSFVASLRVVDLGCGDLAALRECAPRRERFEDEAEYARRCRIPMFLLLAGVRAAR